MTRLFVDVDDTLVLYDKVGPNPYGLYHGTPWTPNHRLVEGIKQFRLDNPTELIVVWSGGGLEYAHQWNHDLGFDDTIISLTKDVSTLHLVRDGDIVVDDQDLGGKRTHKPDEWPE